MLVFSAQHFKDSCNISIHVANHSSNGRSFGVAATAVSALQSKAAAAVDTLLV
jgi:hypothetical protein